MSLSSSPIISSEPLPSPSHCVDSQQHVCFSAALDLRLPTRRHAGPLRCVILLIPVLSPGPRSRILRYLPAVSPLAGLPLGQSVICPVPPSFLFQTVLPHAKREQKKTNLDLSSARLQALLSNKLSAQPLSIWAPTIPSGIVLCRLPPALSHPPVANLNAESLRIPLTTTPCRRSPPP